MLRLTVILVLLFFCVGAQNPLAAQWIRQYRDIVTVHSANGLFMATATPARQFNLSTLGKTELFSVPDSQLLYTIPVCLAEGEMFVSNDGKTVLHLLNSDFAKEDEPSFTHCFTLYADGVVSKQLTLKELTGCDKDTMKCLLFFNLAHNFVVNVTPRDSLISNRAAFSIGDTVFIYTAARKLLRVFLPTGRIDELPFSYHSESQLRQIAPQTRSLINFKCPNDYVNDGEELLADKLKMLPRGDSWYDCYKYYRVSILLRIDRDGSATIVEMHNRDSLPEKKIRNVIGTMKFYVDDFPDGIDFWYRNLYGSMRKRNKVVARREGKEQQRKEHEEYERRLVADSIEGIYIPRNIEDCFHSLDRTLSYRNRKVLMSKSSRGDMAEYHFGLGMWMRNNWGLWGGSRLQKYCEERGLYHPDDMSGAILRFYYDYLHGQDSAWRAFDTTIVQPPPPDTATVALPQYRVIDRNLRRVMKRVVKGRKTDVEDEEDDDENISKNFLLTISTIVPDDTSDAEKRKIIEELKGLEEYSVVMPFGNGKSSDSTFQPDKPFEYLTFEVLDDILQYCRQPVYGYVSFRGRTFLLTEKEINSGFLKPTGKSRRFWKPAKYEGVSYWKTERVYVYSNGFWYCF